VGLEPPVVSVVTPMYNEGANVERFVSAVDAVLQAEGVRFEIILVDDGSDDDTWQRIEGQARQNPRVRGLSLSRNFGQQNSLFAGLHHARGQAIISMDGDLQHPPSALPGLIKAWRAGHQVVTTTRRDSADTSWLKKVTSRWFYRLFSRLSGTHLPHGSSDFRLIDARVRDAILSMRDTDLFLRGMVGWLGFSNTTIAYEADARGAGDTKYNFPRMFRFSLGAIFAFSLTPLRMGIWLGFLTTGLALLEIVYAVVSFFQGKTVRGWSTVIVLMSLMFAVTFILLGVIGIYLGKIFEILKGRHRFIVSRHVGFGDQGPTARLLD
jgi:polyisoprenyl-phosphate glycosyltransferase